MPHYERNIRFILFLILPILGFLLGWSLSQKNTQTQPDSLKTEVSQEKTSSSISKITPGFFKKAKPKDVDLDIFWETWNTVEANFLDPDKLNAQDQIYGATKGLLKSLDDPYTIFLTPEENAQFEESMSGAFEGIGAEIAIKKDQLTIVTPPQRLPRGICWHQNRRRHLQN